MCSLFSRHSLVSRLGPVLLIMLVAADESTAQTQPSGTVSVAIGEKHGKTPSEWAALDDSATFASITAPMAATARDGDLIVRTIEKLPEYKVYTGAFLWTTNGPKRVTKVLQPKPGMMMVKVIFDLYSDKEPVAREEAFDSPKDAEKMTGPLWSEVLWKDDIALLKADGSPVELICLMRQEEHFKGYVITGFNGLEIWKGGNRIAIVFAGKDGDPRQLHLRIRGKDYGTLGRLTRG